MFKIYFFWDQIDENFENLYNTDVFKNSDIIF